MDTEKNTNPQKMTCPVCGKETDSLKYRMNTRVNFYVIFFDATTDRKFLCPHCLRKEILKTFLLNLLTCHILFLAAPAIFLFSDLPQLILSYRKGHSPRLLKALQENADS